jgi:hypothetical protein
VALSADTHWGRRMTRKQYKILAEIEKRHGKILNYGNQLGMSCSSAFLLHPE